MALRTGTRLGPYDLLDLLGKGGMGEVYRARDPRLGRDVAVKVLPPAVARDAIRLRRFEHEARVAAGLGHPNVLTIYDVGTQRGAPYLVTELLDGHTLRQRLIGGALPVSRALDYAGQIARGLAAAHDKGIVHRDLKPENVFVTHDGRVKILDFGIAKLTHARHPGRLPSRAETPSAAELPIGTAGYTSPEQARGEAVDHRCDIFSFGAVLYEMLSGLRAFRGENVVETLHAVLRDEPPRLAEVAHAVPESIDRIVRRCLEKRRQERFQSAHDLALALEALAGAEVSPPAPDAERSFLDLSRLSAAATLPESARAETTPGGTIVVGRETELAELASHLTRALAGRGRVVFVTGEAGTGKTVLAGAFARRSQRDHLGLIVAGGGCSTHTGPGDPYLPFREILGLLTGDVDAPSAVGSLPPAQADALAALMPVSIAALVESGRDLVDTLVPGSALLSRTRAVAPSGAAWLGALEGIVERRASATEVTPLVQASLFAQYARVLQQISRSRPLLLLLDDLQWADTGTIGLLFHLGRHIEESRVVVVGLFRPSDVALGREGARHPLEAVVHELERVFGCAPVELGEGEDRRFVDALLDTEANRLDEQFRQSFTHRTNGNPLFAVELLRDMQERDLLRRDAQGRWLEVAGLSWPLLPARVEAVIAERVGRLPERLQRILAVASVEGEEFTAEAVSRVVGVDDAELVRLLGDELDRRHHLVRARGLQRRGGKRLSKYRFRHFLFAQYLYGRLDDVERARLHESLGRALEELYGEAPGDVALELARHFREAGAWERAIDHLREAASRAHRASAYEEARTHHQGALELLGRLPPSTDRSRRELELQLDFAWATFFARGYGAEEAARALLRARELCAELGERALNFRLAMSLCVYRWCRAEHAESLKLAEEALLLAQNLADEALLVIAQGALGTVLAQHGRFAPGRAQLEEALARHERSGEPPRIVPMLDHDPGQCYRSLLSRWLWSLGFPDLAVRRAAEAEGIARALTHPHSLAHAAYFAGMVHLLCRNVPAVLERVRRLDEVSREWPFPVWVAGARVLRGWCAAREGRFEEALAEMREGLEGWRGAGLEIDTPTFLGLMADTCAASGRVEEGRRLLEEALEAVDRTGERFGEAELHRLAGHLSMCGPAPRPDEAERSFRRAVEVARHQEARSWELRAATSLARLLAPCGRKDEARGVLSELFGSFSEGFDTPDLQDARAMLKDLQRGANRR